MPQLVLQEPWRWTHPMKATQILTQWFFWLVVDLPLWKIWVRHLGWWHSQYREKYNSCSKPPTSYGILWNINEYYRILWVLYLRYPRSGHLQIGLQVGSTSYRPKHRMFLKSASVLSWSWMAIWPSKLTKFATLKPCPVEIVDLPINSMVDLSSSFFVNVYQVYQGAAFLSTDDLVQLNLP